MGWKQKKPRGGALDGYAVLIGCGGGFGYIKGIEFFSSMGVR